jgi:prolyl 4-hydroxylase
MTEPFNKQRLHADANRGIPEAQLLLSQMLFREHDLPGMLHWLSLASQSNLPAANEALAYCYETGRAVTRSYSQALALYSLAAEQGLARAAYRKAEILYKSRGQVSHLDEVLELLTASAEGSFTPAWRTLGYLASQSEAHHSFAVQALEIAATEGDIPAAFSLGLLLRETSPGTAGHWLQKATAAGYPLADLLSQALPVENFEEPAVPSAVPAIPRDLPLLPTTEVSGESISTDPIIEAFDHALDAADCAHLISLALPHMQRADVIDPGGNKTGHTSEVRTNSSTYLSFSQVDIMARFAELKIVQASGHALCDSEPMSILRYSPGEYYQPHYDYFSPTLAVSRKHLAEGGQRVASAVTCLYEPDGGGGTSFPNLHIAVPAKLGRTLYFRNCTGEGDPDPRTLHAGDPVQVGQKWAVTKWFRQRDANYLEH